MPWGMIVSVIGYFASELSSAVQTLRDSVRMSLVQCKALCVQRWGAVMLLGMRCVSLQVRALFRVAAEMQPSVIFIGEPAAHYMMSLSFVLHTPPCKHSACSGHGV